MCLKEGTILAFQSDEVIILNLGDYAKWVETLHRGPGKVKTVIILLCTQIYPKYVARKYISSRFLKNSCI